MGGLEYRDDSWEEDATALTNNPMAGIRVDDDGEHGYQTLTVGSVQATDDFVRVVVSEGGIIILHPDYVDQFSLREALKPGAVLEVKRSLWPNGGIVDIRAAAAN